MLVQSLTRTLDLFNKMAVPHLLFIGGEYVGQPFCTFMSLVHQPLGPGPHDGNEKAGGAKDRNCENDPEDGAIEFRITECHKAGTIMPLVIDRYSNLYPYLKQEIDATISTSGECVAQNTIRVGTCSSGARLAGGLVGSRESREIQTKMHDSKRAPIGSE